VKQYLHVFFDLDHTLWDYDRNSAEVLTELFYEHQLDDHGVTVDQFIAHFKATNRNIWRQYDQQAINRTYVREERFRLVLKSLKVADDQLAHGLSVHFLDRCPRKIHLQPQAQELLDYLSKKYELHIITNGFEDVQHIKLKSSGIRDYFKAVVTSESANHRKPMKEIYEFAMEQAGAELPTSIMIGDNLNTDILGATQVKMDSIYYNHGNARTKPTLATYEVSQLWEITKIL